jgi:hypothetical protein
MNLSRTAPSCGFLDVEELAALWRQASAQDRGRFLRRVLIRDGCWIWWGGIEPDWPSPRQAA